MLFRAEERSRVDAQGNLHSHNWNRRRGHSGKVALPKRDIKLATDPPACSLALVP